MSARAMGALADGARPGLKPTSDNSPVLPPPTGEGLVVRAGKTASRIRRNEGLRGYSVRTQVWTRYCGYFLTIVLCYAAANWAFAGIPAWRHGGEMLLYSVCTILVVSVVGSVLYADKRDEIQRAARQYAFGIVALPGAFLSLFMRIVARALATNNGDDMFVSMLRGNGLPLMYMTLVIVPVFVYVKYIFGGIRSQNRSGLVDEEFIATYMRQDGIQR